MSNAVLDNIKLDLVMTSGGCRLYLKSLIRVISSTFEVEDVGLLRSSIEAVVF